MSYIPFLSDAAHHFMWYTIPFPPVVTVNEGCYYSTAENHINLSREHLAISADLYKTQRGLRHEFSNSDLDTSLFVLAHEYKHYLQVMAKDLVWKYPDQIWKGQVYNGDPGYRPDYYDLPWEYEANVYANNVVGHYYGFRHAGL